MRGRSDRDDPPTEVNLPITAMLDMSFQLLMYFILTYHPSAMEGQMDLSLPLKNTTQSHDGNTNPPEASNKDPDPEIPLDLNVRMLKQQAGYTITLEEAGVNTDMGTNKDQLGKHLEKVFKDKATAIQAKVKEANPEERENVLKDELKKVAVKVQPDSKVKYGDVVEVMDACRMAGVRAFKEVGFDVGKLTVVGVSFAAPPDLGQ